MVEASPNWSTRKLRGTFARRDLPNVLTLETGTYQITAVGRIANVGTDGIKRTFREGVLFTGKPLMISPLGYSLEEDLKTIDDADNFPPGGKYVIEVALDQAGTNKKQTLRYELSPSESLDPEDYYDLADLIPDVVLPLTPPNVLGKKGGIALLDKVTGNPLNSDGVPVGAGTTTVDTLGQATTVGKTFLKSADAAAARTAIGAGVSSLAVGTTSSTAKAGDYAPTAANISDATALGRNVLKAVDAAAARTAIGAGTSSLALGTTGSTAKAGDYAPNAAAISDATTVGRNVLKAADAAAARTAIGAGVSDLAIGTTSSTAKAGNYAPTAAAISDATTIGRQLLTAANQAAVQTIVGASGGGGLDFDFDEAYAEGTASAQDTTAPVIATFTGTVTSTSVALSWTITETGSGVKESVLLADGVEIYRGIGLSFTHSGLLPSSSHTYTLTVTDNSNLSSTPSNLSKTTAAPAGQTFADTFTRANTTSGWGNGWGTFNAQTNTGTVAANQAKVPADGSSTTRQFKAPTHPTSDAHWSKQTVTGLPTGTSRIHAGTIVRGTDNGAGVATTGYAGFWQGQGGPGGAGGWTISRRGASPVVVASVDQTTEPTAPYEVYLEVKPNSADNTKVDLVLKKDGVTVASVTDSSPPPNGKECGVHWYSTTTSSNTAIDNYANGDLV